VMPGMQMGFIHHIQRLGREGRRQSFYDLILDGHSRP
jgi:hypothetical protein